MGWMAQSNESEDAGATDAQRYLCGRGLLGMRHLNPPSIQRDNTDNASQRNSSVV